MKATSTGFYGLVAGLALLLGHAGTAAAVPTLDFGIRAGFGTDSGVIQYVAPGGTLDGIGIEVDEVSLLGGGGPPPQPRTCFGCLLNFTSGNLKQVTANAWEFFGGGSFTVTGTVDLNGNGINDDGGPVALLSGQFSGLVTVLQISGVNKIVGAGIIDQKDPRLLELYGLPTGVPYAGGLNLSFQATGTPQNGTQLDTFVSTQVASGDITNQPTPEPGSLLLLGSGLAGLGYLMRRRFPRSGAV